MKIAIINNTSFGTSGGHLKYLSNILPRLDKNEKITELLVISPQFYKFPYKNILSKKICFKTFTPLSIFHGQRCSYELKMILDQFGQDVIFIPNERFISYKKVPTIVMVRNMEPLIKIINNTFREKIVNYIKYITTLRSCRKATHIVAVSHYVKETLIKSLKINNNKISMIYHGGTDTKNIGKLIKPKSVSISNTKQFLFTAGSIRPARGLEDIIIALGILNKKDIITPDLLIAGNCVNNMLGYKKNLINLIKNNNIQNKVKWCGSLTEQEMSWCYHHSIATIITSRVESFCMIAHEALVNGANIISTNNKCLPEILGEGAIYYQSENSFELSQLIKENINSIHNKKQIAIDRSLFFSWNKCAAELINILNKIK